MRVLGAILAGGRSRRFGTDKALALLDGRTMIDRVAATLRTQVDDIVVCGRAGGIADRPSGIGPLGGISAALHHAREHAFDLAVTVPCDTPTLPLDLVAQLARSGKSSFVQAMPVIAAWPAALAATLDAYLGAADGYSIRGWASHVDAEEVEFEAAIPNINTQADLAALAAAINAPGCSTSR